MVNLAQRCDFPGERPDHTEATARRPRNKIIVPLVRYAAQPSQQFSHKRTIPAWHPLCNPIDIPLMTPQHFQLKGRRDWGAREEAKGREKRGKRRGPSLSPDLKSTVNHETKACPLPLGSHLRRCSILFLMAVMLVTAKVAAMNPSAIPVKQGASKYRSPVIETTNRGMANGTR